MQDTSLEAFIEIQPKIGARQKQVFDAIKEMGNATDMEVAKKTGIGIRSVGPRRNELVKMGLVTEFGRGTCSVTKKSAISWMVNYETD